MAVSRVIVGPRVVCYLNGRAIGRVTDFGFESLTPKKSIRGIDVSNIVELAPTTVEARGTINLIRLAEDGGIQGIGIAAKFTDVSREKYFTIQLIDRLTDTTIFFTNTASCTGESWNVPAKGRMQGSFSFQCLTWDNEATST